MTEPTIPVEPADERPPRTPDQLHAMFERLGTSQREYADRWHHDRRRVTRWLDGREEAPLAFENALELLQALVVIRRALTMIGQPKDRPMLLQMSIAVVSGTLERMVGGEHAGAVLKDLGCRPFICPDCATVSWNINDTRSGYCARCDAYTDDPLDVPD